MRRLIPLATAVLSITAVVGVQVAAAHPRVVAPVAAQQTSPSGHPAVSPTVTQTPPPVTPTPTPIAPVATVTQSPTPIAPVATLPSLSSSSIPMCDGKGGRPAHDPTRWHPLVAKNADGSILCTYGHEHGSDPSVLESIFGSVAGNVGQEISYPWHTPNENSTDPLTVQTADGRPIDGGKHNFYKWEVMTAQQLQAAGKPVCENPWTPYSFDNMRMEVHADGNAGATIRFHSFYVEAETCDPQDPNYHGIVKIGGHIDYGHLMGLENTPQGPQDVIIPLPVDPTYSSGQRRIHGTTEGSCAGCSGAFRGDFTWYGASNTQEFQTAQVAIGVSDGIREQDWGPVDPKNPAGPVQFYGTQGGTTYDHGQGVAMHLVAVGIPAPATLGATARPDGTFDWSGYVDRHGNVVTCSTVGVDCIPVTLTNVKRGNYQYTNDEPQREFPMTNYDVKAPNGQALIQFPN